MTTRLPDPTDLDALRGRLAASAASAPGRRPIGMERIVIAPEALELLEDEVARLLARGPAGPVALLMDATQMRRAGADLKADVVARLSGRFDTRVHVLGQPGHELHADEAALAEAEAAVAGAGCVVAVGSGTVTDLAKHASHLAGDPPFLVVQTAVSVNAFSDDMAVLLRDGVKRTVPSRWPDVLLVDLGVVADAPLDLTRAGFGELCSSFTAPADWLLAGAVGMDDTVDPGVIALYRDGAKVLLRDASAMAAGETEALAELARRMTLTGIAMGVAGRTAPLSGTEHLVSHLLDMAAGAAGRPLALHGAQVGVATIVAALAWDDVFASFEPAVLLDDRSYPDPAAVEPQVRAAFAELDPSGRMAVECWRDVGRKLERWRAARPQVERAAAAWPALVGRLRAVVASPGDLVAGLAGAQAAMRSGDLEPAPEPASLRWALRSLPLMRDRFTVVDLLWLTGSWDAERVEGIVARAEALADAASARPGPAVAAGEPA